MAKKKQKSVELKDKKIGFTLENVNYEVVRFYPSKMTLDLIKTEKNERDNVQDFPFAHLPREIKKLIKPN